MVNKVDGRTSRGQENKRQIVHALIELIQEGEYSPTAEAVSARAGVALRTVFRHFKDMETLYREIAGEVDNIVAPVLLTPFKGQTWEEKVLEAVDRRADMFENLAQIQTATLIHRHESPFLQQQHARAVELQRTLLKAFLPRKVVQNKVLFESLDLCLSFDSWLRLRQDQKLSKAAAKKVMRHCVSQLIMQAGESTAH